MHVELFSVNGEKMIGDALMIDLEEWMRTQKHALISQLEYVTKYELGGMEERWKNYTSTFKGVQQA